MNALSSMKEKNYYYSLSKNTSHAYFYNFPCLAHMYKAKKG